MRFATRLVQVCSAAVLIATSSSALAASVGPTKPSQMVGTITLAAIDAAHPPAVGSTSALIAGAITDAFGTLVGQSVLPTGMVIKPPALPCVGAPLPGTVVVTLNGFFTKDK